jgi:hypothetical protein
MLRLVLTSFVQLMLLLTKDKILTDENLRHM